jgi:hypothetical protein
MRVVRIEDVPDDLWDEFKETAKAVGRTARGALIQAIKHEMVLMKREIEKEK